MEARFRELKGPADWVWKSLLGTATIAGILYILSVHVYFNLSIFVEQYVGLFFGLILAATFLGMPPSKSAAYDRLPWYDGVLALLSIAVGLYITVMYPQIALLFGYVTPDRVFFGVIALLLVLEALRRLTGWILVVVVLVFITYAFVASHMPGPLNGTTTSVSNLANYLYLDSNSMLQMLNLAATIALAFMFFGQVLMAFGGSDLLNDLAISVFGRFRGGPAKAAVIGSSLVGTVTGGPVTNVILTGSVTIPLMIKTGYSRVRAGAIEAVASTGGQIMPPVMGVAAFLIADYLGIPYGEVAIAALVPALLYYLCMFMQVDLVAAKEGIKGLAGQGLPSLGKAISNGWVIFPALGVLIYTVVILRYDPSTSGVISAGVAVPLLLLRQEARKRILQRIMGAIVGTGQVLIEVTIVLAAAGIIVGVTGITGLGFNMALALTQVGDYSLFALLLVSAIVCIILGMGMPSVAAYALVAVLVGPAIVELGVYPLAAHLFIFYFAIISNFTPPIALACFAAAPIAGTSPNKIGFEAVKLGVVAYLVPFLFVYSPTLILEGGPTAITLSILTAVVGTIFLSVALVGFFFKGMSVASRVLLASGSLALLVPFESLGSGTTWIVNLLGFLLVVVIVLFEWQGGRRSSRLLDVSAMGKSSS